MFLNHKNKNRPKWPTCYKQQTQGCRSGPESSRQNLVSPMGPIFRSMLGTSFGGLFPKMLFGDKSTKFECVIPNSWKIFSRLAITKVYLVGLTNMTRGKLTTFFLWIHRLIHGPGCFVFSSWSQVRFSEKKKTSKKSERPALCRRNRQLSAAGFFPEKFFTSLALAIVEAQRGIPAFC